MHVYNMYIISTYINLYIIQCVCVWAGGGGEREKEREREREREGEREWCVCVHVCVCVCVCVCVVAPYLRILRHESRTRTYFSDVCVYMCSKLVNKLVVVN
jgi:hypothetical protein